MSKEVQFRITDINADFEEVDVHIKPYNLVELWQGGDNRIQLSIPQALALCSRINTFLQENFN